MSKRFKHSEDEAAQDWNTDTRTDERIDCLKIIEEYKTMSRNIAPYEHRRWDELPRKVQQKLRRLYDDSMDSEVE